MSWYKPWTWGDESSSAVQKRDDLNQQAGAASYFAGQGEDVYHQLGSEANASRDYLRKLATGQESVSGEQLRQGLQQNLAAQRSMAASAAPQNSAMAARTAAMQAGRMGAGMSGQAALAGMQERQAAQKALMDSILAQRQQDMGVALGSRQNALSGYGAVTPDKSAMEKWAQPVTGFLGATAKFSDKRLKEDVEDGDGAANEAMKGLRAFTYRYKDKKLSTTGGKSELGIMAQDLEKAGLKHTVFDTPRGKAVNGAALSTTNTAMLAALERRVRKMEKGGK